MLTWVIRAFAANHSHAIAAKIAYFIRFAFVRNNRHGIAMDTSKSLVLNRLSANGTRIIIMNDATL